MRKIEFNHEGGFCAPEQGKELEKLLKKAGVEAESYYAWAHENRFHGCLLGDRRLVTRFHMAEMPNAFRVSGSVSAYSCAELMVLLPTGHKNKFSTAKEKASFLIKAMIAGWINAKNIAT